MRNSRAFTLIELLVVVAIIVALLAILSPSMGRASEMGHRARCAANQHQYGVAAVNFASDHFGLFPRRNRSINGAYLIPDDMNGDETDANNENWRVYGTTVGQWVSYGVTYEAMRCPSAPDWPAGYTPYAKSPLLAVITVNDPTWGDRIRGNYMWLGGLDKDYSGGTMVFNWSRLPPANHLNDTVPGPRILGGDPVNWYPVYGPPTGGNHRGPDPTRPAAQVLLMHDGSVRVNHEPYYAESINTTTNFSFRRDAGNGYYYWEGSPK